jgi:molybdate transport system regulatory protein
VTRLTIRIDFDGARHVGHGKIRLIEMVGEHGSISGAARAMGMSYRRAWLLLDEVNRMFREPVVETRLGGKGGGNARLTEFGKGFVDLYRTIEVDAARNFEGRIGELEARLAEGAPAAAQRGEPAPL